MPKTDSTPLRDLGYSSFRRMERHSLEVLYHYLYPSCPWSFIESMSLDDMAGECFMKAHDFGTHTLTDMLRPTSA